MKPKFTNAVLLVFAIAIFVGCKADSQDSNKNITLNEDFKSEISAAADQHFKTWFPKIVDTINGGYYTNFEYDWKMSDQQEKCW
ncbi:MAG: hypothetical protein IPL23_27050 [Saprospiraceae bacterium]|nr:hypothetical protein [Saprospiraceae bacterium]